MCDVCQMTQPESPGRTTPKPKRRRLWEIEERLHCPIVGSCLDVKELRSLARKFGFAAPEDHEFTVHVRAVMHCQQPNGVARHIEKLLDRKFARWIRQAQGLDTSAALSKFWHDGFAKGEVAAAMWAVVTHPLSDEALRQRVYADVHMLSHQVGSGHAMAHLRLSALEQEAAALKGRLLEQAQRHTLILAEKEACIQQLQSRCAELQQRVEALEQAEKRLAMFESGEIFVDLTQQLLRLEGACAGMRHQIHELKQYQAKAEALEHELERTRQERDLITQEHEALERLWLQTFGETTSCPEDCARCPTPQRARCVLCVSGRPNLLAHYRRLSAQFGIELLYHDGGKEDALSRLPELIQAADAVMISTDSVSHSAYYQVKHWCRRSQKPCLLSKNASIASFAAALMSLAQGTADERVRWLNALENKPSQSPETKR